MIPIQQIRVFRSLACFAILILGSCLAPMPVGAASVGPLTASAEAHGIRISISLPHRSYPLNALAVATITARNVGKGDRFLPDWPPAWGGPFSPHVRMRTPAGKLVYQEELSTFLTPTPGSHPATYILHPGRGLTWRVRFVLQAAQVQAVDRVANGYLSYGGHGAVSPPRSMFASNVWTVASPFVSVALTHEPPPAVGVVPRGRTVVATVRPGRGMTGKPFYMDSTYCPTGPSVAWTNQHRPWTIAPHNSIAIPLNPHCKQPQWWHAVIGWPDHAVAFVRYVRR